MRRAAGTIAAAGVLTACLAGGLAGPARATGRHPAAGSAAGSGLHVTISSVSPDIARLGKTVTVTGVVTNHGHTTAAGLTGFLRSSPSSLQYRSQLDEYATGRDLADQQVTPAVTLPDVAPGRSTAFRMSFNPSNAGIQQFGVYPLAVEVDAANQLDTTTGQSATARTFLPFWSGSQPGMQKLKLAWIWPLIEAPQQGACPALLNNTLATSLDAASGGRLGGLLQAGQTSGRSTRITWAVDPALLADANTMTGSYQVITGPKCRDVRKMPASTAAGQWLSSLSSTLSKGQGDQPVFTTPYGDVDVAALTHAGLDTDLASAFTTGRSTATSVLGQRLEAASGGSLEGMAWTPDGRADSSVLDNLAVNGVRTVVLDGNEMPPVQQVDYTPDAVTKVPSGVGSDVRVLLTDDTLSNVLAGAGAAAGSSAAQTEQWFLAETAMIVAEAPGLGRSVVVAPPRQWNPSATLAAGLLSETASAPWLQPEYLNKLKPAPQPASVTRAPLPPSQASRAELGSGYLGLIKPIDASIQRFNSILSRPDPTLRTGVARAESAAWRGGGQAAGRDMIGQVGRYAADEEARVRVVINSSGVTLSGARGNVPVSITNQLPRGYTATVQLEASTAATRMVPAVQRLTIGKGAGPFLQTVTIRGGGETTTVRLPVHALSAGLTEVNLRLLTANGAALSARPTVLKVRSTPFGFVAEVIIAVAAGVMVITSLFRMIRRGLREGRPTPPGVRQQEPASAGEPQPAPSTADSSADGVPDGADGVPDGADGGAAGEAPPPAEADDQEYRATWTSGQDWSGFSSGPAAGAGAGTVMTENGEEAGNQHAQHHGEEPDEFADAWPRARPDTP